jgi:hypothetical protein
MSDVVDIAETAGPQSSLRRALALLRVIAAGDAAGMRLKDIALTAAAASRRLIAPCAT